MPPRPAEPADEVDDDGPPGMDKDEDGPPGMSKDGEDDDDDGPPGMEKDGGEIDLGAGEADDIEEGGAEANKAEKKARKALAKHGLKPLAGSPVTKMVVKKGRATHFVVHKPDVFTAPSGTYIVFGEADADDEAPAYGGVAAGAPAGGARGGAGGAGDGMADLLRQAKVGAGGAGRAAPAEEDGEVVDAQGIDDKDINLVMEQAGVSRGKAIKALLANERDIVNTIMELTSGAS